MNATPPWIWPSSTPPLHPLSTSLPTCVLTTTSHKARVEATTSCSAPPLPYELEATTLAHRRHHFFARRRAAMALFFIFNQLQLFDLSVPAFYFAGCSNFHPRAPIFDSLVPTFFPVGSSFSRRWFQLLISPVATIPLLTVATFES
uniref:Uncharacterized protein n=1 Tax=Triticum urartu TaxID=4572 RepID=A0A8R7P2P6_TRIUA